MCQHFAPLIHAGQREHVCIQTPRGERSIAYGGSLGFDFEGKDARTMRPFSSTSVRMPRSTISALMLSR